MNKFSHEPLRSKLIATGSEYIQEGNWWGDTFWGVDLKADHPHGDNRLGIMLMEIRNGYRLDGIL